MAEGLDEFFGRPKGPPALRAYECDVLNDATDTTDTIDVKERNGNRMMHNDCNWSPRIDDDGLVAYPSKGDRALVLLSDEGEPWIIEWRPSA